jgi:hypothetical protein
MVGSQHPNRDIWGVVVVESDSGVDLTPGVLIKGEYVCPSRTFEPERIKCPKN